MAAHRAGTRVRATCAGKLAESLTAGMSSQASVGHRAGGWLHAQPWDVDRACGTWHVEGRGGLHSLPWEGERCSDVCRGGCRVAGGWEGVGPEDSSIPALAARAQTVWGLDEPWPVCAHGTFHTLKSEPKRSSAHVGD